MLRILVALCLSWILSLIMGEGYVPSLRLLIQSEVCLEMVNKCSKIPPPLAPAPAFGMSQFGIIRFPSFKRPIFLSFFFICFPAIYLPYSSQHRGDLNNNTTLQVNGAFHPSISKISVNMIQLNTDYEHHFEAKEMGTIWVSDLPKVTHEDWSIAQKRLLVI